MNRILVIFIILVQLTSCSEKPQPISPSKDGTDTLQLTEEMLGEFHLSLAFDDADSELFIPRNKWVTVHAKGEKEMIKMLEHTDLYLESLDTGFLIKRLSNYEYKFYVKNSYSGYIPDGGPIAGQECLEIYPHIQPHKGFVLKTYWTNKLIAYPEKTMISQLLYGLEMVK